MKQHKFAHVNIYRIHRHVSHSYDICLVVSFFFVFSPLLGEDFHNLTHILFRWVGEKPPTRYVFFPPTHHLCWIENTHLRFTRTKCAPLGAEVQRFGQKWLFERKRAERTRDERCPVGMDGWKRIWIDQWLSWDEWVSYHRYGKKWDFCSGKRSPNGS